MAGMLALMLLAASTCFRSFGLLTTIHAAVIVAVSTASFGMLLVLTLLMLALLMLAVLLVTLLMLTLGAMLLVLFMTLVLGRGSRGWAGLSRGGSGDHERGHYGEILHRHSPEIHKLKEMAFRSVAAAVDRR